MPRAGRVQRPAEVDPRVGARQTRGAPSSAVVVEVLAAQARDAVRPCRRRRQLRGRNDDVLARHASGSRRVAHVARRRAARANAVEDRDLSRCPARCSRRAAPPSASVPITAIDRSVVASGSVPRVVLEQHDRRARRLARERAMLGAGHSSTRRCPASTYGCSNSPSSNFARSTRATAASITESAISPRWNASRYGRVLRPTTTGRSTSSPASSACFAAVGGVRPRSCAAPSRRRSPPRRR